MISTFWEWMESRRRIPWKVALLLFGLGLCQPQNAPAQWTVPDSNQNIHNTNTGNVGIGITNPIATLHVLAPTSAVGVYVDTYGSQPILRFRRANGTAGNQPVNSGDILGNLAFSGFGASAYSNFASSRITAVASENWTDQAQGSSLGLYTTPTGSPAGAILRLNVDPFGNVAVGPPSSGAPTPVLLDLNGGFFHTTFNTTTVPATNINGGLTVGWNRSSGAAEVNFYNIFRNGTTAPTTAFQFSLPTGTGGATDLLTIAANGNVTASGAVTGAGLSSSAGVTVSSGGITVSNGGISAPNGTITANNVIANYQDVAEWVPASMRIPAGTVVVIDAGVTNHVLPSSTPYDTRVAGVISTNPGVILGQRGEDKVMVATTGRVKVRVDATSAPIRVGDLLVTSDKEGVAMRSMPVDLGGTPIHRPGTLIGKALEPLASGIGEILVLLSLQ